MPYDINGRLEVVGHTAPITIGSVIAAQGDLIVANGDGVAVVSIAAIDEVLARVASKAEGENGFRAAVADGAPPSEAFDRFGVH